MSFIHHHHRVLGQGRRVSPTGGIAIPTTFDLQHWENIVQSGDNDAAAGSDDLEQGDESDFVYNNVDESGDITGFTREDVFLHVNPTQGATSLNRIPWEQRRRHPPATAIATMMSPSWQGTRAPPRSGERIYLEPSENGGGFEWRHLPIVEIPWEQLSQGDCDMENLEDEHTIHVADDGEAYSFEGEGVINVGIPSFGFGLPSFERGIPAAHSPPSGFVIDNPLANVEIIPFEEEEKSLS